MFLKLKCFLIEGHISDKCRNINIVNFRTDMWKNRNLAGGDQKDSKTYVISDAKSSASGAKSSVSPDAQPHPCILYPNQPKQYLLEILKVSFNFIAELTY